jgi:hypothetical protein
MQERGVTLDDVAHVWVHYEHERPSQDHPGFTVRIGRTPNGRRVGVVARLRPDAFDIKTVW